MKQALQNKLFKAFPKLFAQKDEDMKVTCMCWGIECPDIWYDVIHAACETIQNNIDWNKKPQIEFTQVKEKFGHLCIYCDKHNDFADGVIAMARCIINSDK
jgi:hypothetical protein